MARVPKPTSGLDRKVVINTVSYLARTRRIDRIAPLDDFDVEMAATLREHLRIPGDHTWAITLEVELSTAAMRERGEAPFRVSRGAFAEAMYWSPAQLVTHHASNGCILNPGDLLGTGTISGPAPDARGCLLERTWRGSEPLALPDGSTRAFLEDGDEVSLVGRAAAAGRPTIGFGPSEETYAGPINDHVRIDDLEKCMAFYASMLGYLPDTEPIKLPRRRR